VKKKRLLELATKLRISGMSYKQIHMELGIAPSTASVWLKNVGFNNDAVKKLMQRQVAGRSKGWATLRRKKLERGEVAKLKAIETLKSFILDKNVSKILCSFLYWGEGAKTEDHGVVMANSDPLMIRVFLYLLRSSFDINEQKLSGYLHLHSYHDIEVQKNFWSNVTGIPHDKIKIYLKKESGINKRAGYPGCIQIRYNSVELFKEISFLYKLFEESKIRTHEGV
jgi:hypothetical protein